MVGEAVDGCVAGVDGNGGGGGEFVLAELDRRLRRRWGLSEEDGVAEFAAEVVKALFEHSGAFIGLADEFFEFGGAGFELCVHLAGHFFELDEELGHLVFDAALAGEGGEGRRAGEGVFACVLASLEEDVRDGDERDDESPEDGVAGYGQGLGEGEEHVGVAERGRLRGLYADERQRP